MLQTVHSLLLLLLPISCIMSVTTDDAFATCANYSMDSPWLIVCQYSYTVKEGRFIRRYILLFHIGSHSWGSTDTNTIQLFCIINIDFIKSLCSKIWRPFDLQTIEKSWSYIFNYLVNNNNNNEKCLKSKFSSINPILLLMFYSFIISPAITKLCKVRD